MDRRLGSSSNILSFGDLLLELWLSLKFRLAFVGILRGPLYGLERPLSGLLITWCRAVKASLVKSPVIAPSKIIITGKTCCLMKGMVRFKCCRRGE